jgi:hypothetical protein
MRLFFISLKYTLFLEFMAALKYSLSVKMKFFFDSFWYIYTRKFKIKFMKNRSIIVAAFLLFVSVAVFAQLDSVKIIPTNPSITDSVKVIGYKRFGSGNCGALNIGVTQPGGNWIYVEACHEGGMMSVMCSSVDTTNLGLFSAGKYYLGYIVRRVNPVTDPIDCGGQPLLDSMNISFTVNISSGSGIGVNTQPINTVALYPNPANEAIAIHYELDKREPGTALVIYNIVGQVVKSVPLENKQGAIIENISNLSKGSYFYRIETPTLLGVVNRLNIIE